MSIETYLKEISLFNQLPDEALPKLVEQGEVLHMEAGELVFWEGDASDAMYVILAGEIRVFKRDEEGNEFDINHQKQGECFGELALLDSQPRSASIDCITLCTFFKLEKVAFMNLLLTPETQSTALSILSVLVERVRVITEKYFDEQLAQRTLQAEMEAERHRSLGQMVAGVAHELNTPLGVANTAVGMIASRVNNKKVVAAVQESQQAQSVLKQMQEASDLALRNIQRAHILVERFKKISVNQFVEESETVDLPDLIEDILALFKINARNAQLAITVHNKLLAGEKIWIGYPGHLTQVLTNFLFNIQRYAYPMQTGGKIDITLESDDSARPPAFILTVQDYGIGISPENLDQIFEPFFTTGRIKGGTGLGLAIVHSIITEALNGSIDVQSTLEEGTCFTVTFPKIVDTQ
ncbi:MAG: ATP-binding protein [Chloroflexota bacterium]